MNNMPYHYRKHVLRLTALVGELAGMAGQPVEFQAILRCLDELDERAALLREQVVLMRVGQAMQHKRPEQERRL